MRHLFSSLRFCLTLLVLLAVLPALGLTLYTAVEDYRRETSAIEADTLQLTEAISLEEDQVIAGTRQLLIALAELPQVGGGNSASCNAFLARLLANYELYDNLGVIEPGGNVSCSAIPFEAPVNLADRSYFQQACQSREFAIGDYQIGRITGKPSINFGYPVLGEDGQVEKVVFAALDLNWLNQQEYKVEARLPEGSTLAKIDDQGCVLVHEPDPGSWVGQCKPEIPLLSAVLERKRGSIKAVGLDGESRFYAFVPVFNGLYGDVYIIVGVSESASLAEVYRVLFQNLAGIGLSAILALAAVWVLGDVLILRPVRALLQATERLRNGDLGARAGLSYGRGELAQLACAFDQMAQALERSEAERREVEQQAHKQERLAAIGRAAGGIAHDFNNVLSAIILYAGLPLKTLGQSSQVTRVLEAICQQAQQASSMIQQILDFSRHSPIETGPVDLELLVWEMASVFRDTLPEGVQLVAEVAPDDYVANVDPTRIRQVLMNLVTNARDAMPEGGDLRIGLEITQMFPDEASPVAGMSAGQWVCMSVSDTGAGIPPDVMAHLFEPFFTTKATGKGTGLGLAQVYGIVRQHGGYIGVETEASGGTTFRIYLPVSVEAGS
jgi:signal transduction histidine kinase